MSKRQFIKLAALMRHNRHAFANDYAWEHFCVRLADTLCRDSTRVHFLRACTESMEVAA